MRRRGFTLIELLVVIAIIGILAAMLFPVFARARESARKTQCLAGVKNIATAVNMYFADYDAGFPTEHDAAAFAWFDNKPGRMDGKTKKNCNQTRHANPYLRPAVILDDYVKSREVYKCPSAKVMNGAGVIVPMGRNGYWLNAWLDNTWWQGKGNRKIGPCYVCWPSGWGGDVTDSFIQHKMAATTATGATSSGNGVFLQGIGYSDSLTELNLSSVQDSARYIACGDTGRHVGIWDANGLAYPDTCANEACGGITWQDPVKWSSGPCPWQDDCTVADWTNCPTTQACGLTQAAHTKFHTDSNYRKGFTRHMGGSNVGFLDGHAKWFLSDAIMTQSEPFKDPYFQGGLCSCWLGNGFLR